MILTCPNCQAKYRFDESKLGDRAKARTRCAKCGTTIDIENPNVGAATLPPESDFPSPEPPEPSAPPPPASPAAPEPVTDERVKTQRKLTPLAPETGSDTMTGQDLQKAGMLELPKDKRYSLAVIQGPTTGQIYQVTKTRTTLGRMGADVNLNDPEASRQHAVLEILGDRVMLRDLGSTNGTFVDAERIDRVELNNQAEFRIGSHVLMLIVTEIE